jgi:hypothetical protein
MLEARGRPIFSSGPCLQFQPELSTVGSARGNKPGRSRSGHGARHCAVACEPVRLGVRHYHTGSLYTQRSSAKCATMATGAKERNARLSESYKCPHSDFSSRDLIWIKLWEQFEAGFVSLSGTLRSSRRIWIASSSVP